MESEPKVGKKFHSLSKLFCEVDIDLKISHNFSWTGCFYTIYFYIVYAFLTDCFFTYTRRDQPSTTTKVGIQLINKLREVPWFPSISNLKIWKFYWNLVETVQFCRKAKHFPWILPKFYWLTGQVPIFGCWVWQYRWWSFQERDTKLERFLAKNQL